MITLEELFTQVETEFKEMFARDERSLKKWERMKDTLTPHIEQYPGEWFIDEDGNEDCEYIEEVVSYANTEEDELADFCWLCGCTVQSTQSWYDGSYSYCITLPETEEEYQKNLEEASAYWAEAYGD